MPRPAVHKLVTCAGRLGVLALVACFAAPSASAEDVFTKDIQPFLAKHCLGCHDGDSPEGKLSLGQFKDLASVSAKPDLWHKVQTVLRLGKMPPPEEDRPDAAEVKRVVEWVDREVLKIDCGAARDPGRVTIRRLNRTEYANTIRDLLGVEFRATDEFPVDDTGYGFDNIGDVLSMSPLLLEKYLAAAETITAKAIAADHPSLVGAKKKIEAESLVKEGDGFGDKALGGFLFHSEGRLSTSFDAKPGKYLLRFRAFGEQAGDDPARIDIHIDGKKHGPIDVEARQANPQVYETSVEFTAGERKIEFGFANDYYNPEANRRRGRDRNLMIDYLEVEGPFDMAAPLPEMHQKLLFVTPRTKGETAEDAARKVLRRFAGRAYRRPATRDEVRRLTRFVQDAQRDGDTFERGVQLAMQAVLISPHFLFRIEKDEYPDDPARIHDISEHELATRLSYFLWSTMPDEELAREADEGTLRKNLSAQVRRMIADAKFQAFITNFSGQWLETRKLATVTPDEKLFGPFDAGLRDAMRQETELFFGAVVREDLPLHTLIDGKFTFLNERLAKHYGVDGIQGNDFRRVELNDNRRGGVLTHASVLTLTSNPTRTSPVKRGKWIMDQILGTPPPPPPPDVPELKDEGEEATGSLRERMVAHTTNALCASCHRAMDGMGFALENYDAVGRWRDKDGKFAIDPAGETPAGRAFSGAEELRKILATTDRDFFVRCLAEKVLTYGLGRGVEYYDKCTIDDLAAATAKGDYKFSALVQAIVTSDAFIKRRAKRAER